MAAYGCESVAGPAPMIISLSSVWCGFGSEDERSQFLRHKMQSVRIDLNAVCML